MRRLSRAFLFLTICVVPLQGLHAQAGSELRLPGLRNITPRQARERLQREGFKGAISEQIVPPAKCTWTGSLDVGLVCGISVDERGSYPSDTPIVLYVRGTYTSADSAGPVPDVIGMNLEEAARLLEEHRFPYVSVRFHEYRGCVPGKICSADPTSGTVIERRPDQVYLSVATRYLDPLQKAVMDDLSGHSVAEAWRRLDALRIRGRIAIVLNQRRCSREVETGLVCGQSPAPGQVLVDAQGGTDRFYQAPITLYVKP